MRTSNLLICAALIGCAGDKDADTAAAGDVMDLRSEFPTPPEGALVYTTPEYVIPAYTEKQFCWITTYDGPDMGIHGQWNYQAQMGHHVTVFGTTVTEREMPDGESWDCTSVEALEMTSLEPIIIGGSIDYTETGVVNEFVLPEGMAAPLEGGQRIVIQSHYVNTFDTDVLVQDEAHLVLMEEQEVQTWAAPLVNTITELSIPAQEEEYTLTFDCTFEESYDLLYIGGHLHEWGTRFSTDWTRDGVTETIYDVPEWDPLFRDAPVYDDFGGQAFRVEPGDVFTTHCSWLNDTGDVLEFPAEMCVTFGMIYPANLPVICDPG